MGKFLDSVKNKKVDNNKNTSSTTKKVGKFGKSVMESKIGLDTIDTDLKSLGTTVESIYNGWQDQDTMNNTKASIVTMQERLNAYQEYAKLFGGEDVTELANSYQAILEDWDNRAATYSKFKTAEDYTKAAEREKSLPTADLNAVDAEIKELEAQIEEKNKRKPVDYNTLAPSVSFDGIEPSNRSNPLDGIKRVEEKPTLSVTIDPTKSSKTLDELKNELADKKAYYDDAKATQESLALIQKETAMASDPKNMDGYSQYLSYYDAEKAKADEEEASKPWWEKFLNEVLNASGTGAMRTVDIKQDDKSWQLPQGEWSDDEKRVLGGYFQEDPQKAIDYVVRKNNEKAKSEQAKTEKEIQDSATSNVGMGTLHTAVSVVASPLGIFDYIDDLSDAAAGRPVIEESTVSPFEYSQAVKSGITTHLNDMSGTLNENIPVVGGKGIGDVYGLGTGVLQSAASAYALGGFGTLVSYFGQGAAAGVDDALARGATDDQAIAYGFVLGAAEGISENIGADQLLKLGSANEIRKLLVNGFKNGGGKAFWTLVDKQGKAEALEELFNGIAGQVADDYILKGKSNFNALTREYRALGMSAAEAQKKAWMKSIGDVAYDTLSGYISGVAHAGPQTLIAKSKVNAENKTIGKEIRGNERVTDMWDIASLSPQESDAYNAYTQYAKQGVNAENITDAQLGNLYGMSKADAVSAMLSKKATKEQKADAETTYNRLSKMKTENKAAKRAQELAKTDEEGVVTPATREMLINDKANGMSAESEAKAELFRLVDDGHTNVEDYANSFNLVVDLARNEFDQDYILEHRGVLSTGQVNSIYQAVVANPKMAQQKRLEALIKEQGDNLEIKGTIDDSVIDYNNTGAKGKVNWNSLHPNVKATIQYISGFATKVAGMDVQLVTNGREHGFKGMYSRQGNTLLIDITASTEKVTGADTKGRKDNAKFVISTVAHEVTHWMEEKAPELYAQYSKMVMEALSSGKYSEMDIVQYRKKLMQDAENARAKKENRKPHEYTDAEARREVVAIASEDMLALSEEGKKYFESLSESEQKQLVDKIKDVIQDFMDWIKTVLSNLKSESDEAKMLRELAKDLDAISKKWDEMLRQAAKANAAMKKAGVNDKAIMESKASDTQNADIDKINLRRDNVSRANDEGDFVNEFYNALTRQEWKVFYDALTEGGHLKNTRIGTVATVVIGDKLVIAERQYMKKEVHDYVVCDVFKLGNTVSNYDLHYIKDAIEEGVITYDARTIYKKLHKLLKANFSTGILSRFDGDSKRFVDGVTEGENRANNGAIHRNSQEGSTGTGLPLGNQSDIQEDNGVLSKEVSNSDIDIFNINDYTIDDLLKMSDEDFKKAYDSLGLDDLLASDESAELYGSGDVSIYDISEELNTEPEKIEILIRREGLGASHIDENRTAVMTQERIDRSIKDSSARFSPDYARRYITSISTKDFIDLTVLQKNMDRAAFDANVEGDSGNKMGDFDYERALRNEEQSPYLSIDRSTGRIIGHNGRHRIRALEMAGIEAVEIEIEFYDEDGSLIKYNSETIPDLAISSQFDTAIETHISNIVPLNETHRAEVESAYGEKVHGNAGVQYSDIDSNYDAETQSEINQSMTMQQAKDMIQRAFVLNNIKSWYDDQYQNGDEWLAGEGANEVANYIENTYEVYEKYIGSKFQGLVDGEWFVEDIVDAYVNKTLTGKVKQATQWMDLSQNVAVADKRFYSPKEIKNAKKKLEIAKQRLTNDNKVAVTKARAEILLYAHNKGAAETLGLTESDLKKMLRQWGGYSASAREISMRFNNNVAISNRWVGIENCSWLKSAQVSEKELARLVNSIEGDSRGFERNYIARTMLALDTHIDWSEIKFVFTGVVDPKRRSVRGLYDNRTRTVTASYGSQNTVAHEMGHALDYKWARDLGFGGNAFLTDRYLHASQIKTEEEKLWYSHFKEFVSSLTDKADLTSEYTMRDQEVFARFVASFVEWVDHTATGRSSYGYTGFKDKFTGSDYVSFVKILQEKAMLDSKKMSAANDVQYSDIDVDQLDDLNAQLKEKQNQIYSATMELRKFDSKAEEEKLYAVMNKDGVSKEELDAALQAYAKWGEESGYADAHKKHSALKDEEKLIRREIQKVEDRLHNELKEQIAHWDDEDVKKYVAKAVRKYHTTTNLAKASYLVTTGSMLDFSDGQGYRVKDHREISEILDLPDYAEYSDGMIAFMNMGNIRLQTYGVDISAMPNAKQFTALRDIIFKVMRENDEFSVDFSKTDGYSAGSVTYSKGTSTSKIIADIKSYFETGVVPEEQSSIRDFLYSDIDVEVDIYEVLGENERLNKENKALRADFDRLMERKKLERQLTHGNHFNENQLDAVAGHIRNLGNSNYSKPELINKLREVYTYIATSKEVTWDDLFARMYGIAEDVLSVARPTYSPNDYYANIYRDLRSMEISLSDSQKQYVKDMLGVDAHKAFFGKIKVTANGIPLNSKWEELAQKYPNEFAETNDKDQVLELLEIYETAKELKEMVDEYDVVERTRWLANEIYNQYWNVSPIRTTADRYDRKIKQLNYEHRNAMKELRDSYNERLEKQKKADRAERSRIFKKLREDHIKELKEIRQSSKERLDKYKEEAKRKTVIQSMVATTTSMNKKLLTNSKDSHIPEPLKPVVTNLINAIDFSSKRALGMWGGDNKGVPTSKDVALEKTFSKARSMADENISLTDAIRDASKMFTDGNNIFSTIEVAGDLSLATLDLDLAEQIDGLLKTMAVLERKYGDNGFVLERMSLDDLKTLNAMIKSINHWATQFDKALAIKHKEGIANLGMQTIYEGDALGEYKQRTDGIESIKKFLSWSNLLPVNAFERMGTAAQKVFESLQDAQDNLVFNQDEIERFTAELFKGKEKDIKKWREDVRTFDLVLPNGKKKTIRMPVSYMMSLYAVAKQEDAMRHLLGADPNGNLMNQGGGMTIKGFKEKGGITRDRKNTLLTKGLIDKITGELSAEQKYIADKLQEFMNEKGSEWGDSVSMALYGIKKFGIKNYFPITVTPTTIKKLNADNKNIPHFFSILNFGFTKSRNLNAKQSIEIGDIFDVFTNHMTMMAIYNSYALPIYDMVRWYNFSTRTVDGEEIGVINSLQNAFGEEATAYIEKLITDLNGQHESSRLGFINRIFKNTKIAMVGNSLSVAALQITAYPKAALLISPKYLTKSLFYIRDFGAKKGREKAKKYSGIALWKSKGNFDVDISKNMSTRIKHDETLRDKLIDWSLKGAEKGDELTWGMLWNACEFEIRDTRKDLKVGSDEFYEAIAKRLREIVYKTQVVDSPLTKSDIMRSPDGMAKSLTMFASELTVAYNIVSEAIVSTHLDVRKNGKKGAFKRNGKKIAKALTIYTVTSAVSQLFSTAIQVYRDDDDDKEFEDYLKMYLTNFALDWAIIGKLPYIKESLNYAQGYSSSRTETIWMESAFKAAKYWGNAFSGDDGAARKAIENSLKTLSDLTGIAGYNQYRDLMATLGFFGILTKEDFEEFLDEIFG